MYDRDQSASDAVAGLVLLGLGFFVLAAIASAAAPPPRPVIPPPVRRPRNWELPERTGPFEEFSPGLNEFGEVVNAQAFERRW